MSKKKTHQELIQTLTPEQEAFLDEQVIQGRYKAAKWLKTLHKLEKLDHLGDERLKTIQGFYFWPILAIIAGFFMAIFLEDFGRVAGLVAMAFGIVSVIVVAGSIKSLREEDLFNSFRLSAIPIMELLKNDFAPDRKIDLFIDCRMPVDDSTLLEKRKEKNPGFSDTKLAFYEKEWMRGKGKLKDSSGIEWKVVTMIEVKRYWKRGISGKTKVKQKAKAKHKIRIQLELPKKLYEPKAELPENIRVVDAGDFWKVKIKGKSKGKVKDYYKVNRSLEDNWMSPRTFTTAMAKAMESFKKNPQFTTQTS